MIQIHTYVYSVSPKWRTGCVRRAASLPPSPSADSRAGLAFLPVYRVTSLIRNTPMLGPDSGTIPRVLWWS